MTEVKISDNCIKELSIKQTFDYDYEIDYDDLDLEFLNQVTQIWEQQQESQNILIDKLVDTSQQTLTTTTKKRQNKSSKRDNMQKARQAKTDRKLKLLQMKQEEKEANRMKASKQTHACIPQFKSLCYRQYLKIKKDNLMSCFVKQWPQAKKYQDKQKIQQLQRLQKIQRRLKKELG